MKVIAKEFEPLCVEVLDNRKFVVLEDFSVVAKNGEVITVPKGFTTDATSVPRLFWSFLPPLRRYTKAAVVHDYLYRTYLKTKEEADKIFLRLMEDLGVEKVCRTVMYYTVKLFGKKAYEK